MKIYLAVNCFLWCSIWTKMEWVLQEKQFANTGNVFFCNASCLHIQMKHFIVYKDNYTGYKWKTAKSVCQHHSNNCFWERISNFQINFFKWLEGLPVDIKLKIVHIIFKNISLYNIVNIDQELRKSDYFTSDRVRIQFKMDPKF